MIAAAAVVLSLGPQPAAWGHVSAIPGPYQLLLGAVPGLDGLRSVSRIAVIVVLAVCVLAAFGAVQILDRVARAGARGWSRRAGAGDRRRRVGGADSNGALRPAVEPRRS